MENKSIISLSDTFVVIDTETTGLDFEGCDIIEFAAIKYINGEVVDTFSSLCKPELESIFFPYRGPEGTWVHRYVDEYISSITGITNEMLEKAPDLSEVLPKFLSFIGDSVLFGQNTSFDVRFILEACFKIGIPAIQNEYVNIARIARKVFPDQKHYRLSDISEMCGISQESAHRALDDCYTTANCYLLMRSQVLANMDEPSFISKFNKNKKSYHRFIHSIDLENIEPDEDSPIYGKSIVFTGTLEKTTRKQALEIVAKLGGIPSDSISKKTNYLVVGNLDYISSVKNGKSSKILKAEELAKKGADISVISENTFYEMTNM